MCVIGLEGCVDRIIVRWVVVSIVTWICRYFRVKGSMCGIGYYVMEKLFFIFRFVYLGFRFVCME